MLDTPHPPNSLVYSANRETFAAVVSVLSVRSTLLDNQIVERRELHITTTPRSKKLKREFDSMIFRLVENSKDKPVDRNGNPIVGGVNSYPEPVHVVLFVAPETIAMVSQRTSGANLGKGLAISICPGKNILEWDKSEAIPIYDAEFHSS